MTSLTNQKGTRNRNANPITCFASFILMAYAPLALGGDHDANPPATYTPVAEGSTLTQRTNVDTTSGEVYIYVGGSFPAGTAPVVLEFLYGFTDGGNPTGFITPLLFERVTKDTSVLFTVVGIGKGFEVSINPATQEIPFEVIEGAKFTTNGDFTFGFINAILDPNLGSVSTSTQTICGTYPCSPGTVEFDLTADGGEGVGGRDSTNQWGATTSEPDPVIVLGATFGASGSGADYTFWGSYRTYSAQAIGLTVR
jgi:hypothetical protein